MGRQSKSVQIVRRTELAEKMKEGRGYSDEWNWYSNRFGNVEKTFTEDRTYIYKQWKLDYAKDIETAKLDILIRLSSARKRAIDLFDVKAEIQSIKLEAEILGILNKKGEQLPIVINNNTLNIEGLDVEQIKAILYGDNNNRHISATS